MTAENVILVTGATGNVGPHAVRQLVDAGAHVRALVLDGDPGVAALPSGVDIVRGNLADPDSVTAALDDVTAVFLMWPFFTLNVDTAPEVLNRIRQRARRVAFVSSIGVHLGLERRDNNCHAYIEELVEETDLEYTFLRVTGFDCNARTSWGQQILAGDVVRFPCGAAARSSVHEEDVAAVAVHALTTDGHEGRKYLVTGPEALTQQEHVRIIGEALGRPLRWEDVPADVAKRQMIKAGWPVGYADGALDYFARLVTEPELVGTAVEEVTGKPARTFREWATEHVKDFRR